MLDSINDLNFCLVLGSLPNLWFYKLYSLFSYVLLFIISLLENHYGFILIYLKTMVVKKATVYAWESCYFFVKGESCYYLLPLFHVAKRIPNEKKIKNIITFYNIYLFCMVFPVHFFVGFHCVNTEPHMVSTETQRHSYKKTF